MSKQVPATWAEGAQYLKAGGAERLRHLTSSHVRLAGSVAPKDLVVVRSSAGELKFGEVIAKTGVHANFDAGSAEKRL